MSRLRANQITNENANGAPNFPHGLTVTGVVTATTSATTMSQIVVGSAVTANSTGIDVTGIITATSFSGIDSDKISEGNTEVETVDTGSDGHIKFTTEGSDRGRFDNGGRFLVGHTAAHSVSSGNSKIQVQATDSTGRISVVQHRNEASGSPFITLGKSRGTSNGAVTAVNDDDQIGSISWAAADGTDLNNQVACITASINGTVGSNSTPGQLSFKTTAAGANSATENFKIDPEGTLYNTGGYGSLKDGYLARAWLNYDSVNSEINGSKNVSSVTNNGSGRYQVNWSTNFPDDNYAVVSSCGGGGGNFGDESFTSYDDSDLNVGYVKLRHTANTRSPNSVPAHHTSIIAIR